VTRAPSRTLPALTLALSLFLTASPAVGQVIDRTVAVVQDDAIFLSDLEREVLRAKFLQGKKELGAQEEKDLREQVLEQLIAEKLILAKAREQEIEVEPSEVEDAVERQIADLERRAGGRNALLQELERQGMSLQELRATYRDQIRNYILKDRLLSGRIRGRIQVSDEDVREYYQENRDRIPGRPATVELADILIGVRPTREILAEVRERAESVRREALEGADFGELAERYSEGPSAPKGGDLGWFTPGDFASPAFEEAAQGLAVGEISEPVLTDFGYHLIQLVERDGERLHVRHILFRVEEDPREVRRAEALADSIRSLAAQGAPFDSLAVRFSQDEQTKGEGGYLGLFALEDLRDLYQKELEGVDEGGVTEVFRDEAGFRILKVLEREAARSYSFSEVTEDLRKLLIDERRREETEKYVNELREEFSVVVWE
jgi:peptidyl-prolyl cis-trans isomerase SurA